jgi:hypothetical protein
MVLFSNHRRHAFPNVAFDVRVGFVQPQTAQQGPHPHVFYDDLDLHQYVLSNIYDIRPILNGRSHINAVSILERL